MVTRATETPQGTVLSPFLFTLYTSDFCFNPGIYQLQKFFGVSSIVGYIPDAKDDEYRDLIRNFVGWCDRSHLQLNMHLQLRVGMELDSV